MNSARHPSYGRHRFTVSPSRLSAVAESGDFALHEPLMITRDRTIIDGYAAGACSTRGRTTVTCIEYDLTEEEALRSLLHRHRWVEGLNAFCEYFWRWTLSRGSESRRTRIRAPPDGRQLEIPVVLPHPGMLRGSDPIMLPNKVLLRTIGSLRWLSRKEPR